MHGWPMNIGRQVGLSLLFSPSVFLSTNITTSRVGVHRNVGHHGLLEGGGSKKSSPIFYMGTSCSGLLINVMWMGGPIEAHFIELALVAKSRKSFEVHIASGKVWGTIKGPITNFIKWQISHRGPILFSRGGDFWATLEGASKGPLAHLEFHENCSNLSHLMPLCLWLYLSHYGNKIYWIL